MDNWADFHWFPWFPLRVQSRVLEETFLDTYTFNVPIVRPYMWYQNLKHLIEIPVGAWEALLSWAFWPRLRGALVSIYAYRPLELWRVWSEEGPVPLEDVPPPWTDQSKLSPRTFCHVQKFRWSKLQEPIISWMTLMQFYHSKEIQFQQILSKDQMMAL